MEDLLTKTDSELDELFKKQQEKSNEANKKLEEATELMKSFMTGRKESQAQKPPEKVQPEKDNTPPAVATVVEKADEDQREKNVPPPEEPKVVIEPPIEEIPEEKNQPTEVLVDQPTVEPEVLKESVIEQPLPEETSEEKPAPEIIVEKPAIEIETKLSKEEILGKIAELKIEMPEEFTSAQLRKTYESMIRQSKKFPGVIAFANIQLEKLIEVEKLEEKLKELGIEVQSEIPAVNNETAETITEGSSSEETKELTAKQKIEEQREKVLAIANGGEENVTPTPQPEEGPTPIVNIESKENEIPVFTEKDIVSKKGEHNIKLNPNGDFGVEIVLSKKTFSKNEYVVKFWQKNSTGILKYDIDSENSKIFKTPEQAVISANASLRSVWDKSSIWRTKAESETISNVQETPKEPEVISDVPVNPTPEVTSEAPQQETLAVKEPETEIQSEPEAEKVVEKPEETILKKIEGQKPDDTFIDGLSKEELKYIATQITSDAEKWNWEDEKNEIAVRINMKNAFAYLRGEMSGKDYMETKGLNTNVTEETATIWNERADSAVSNIYKELFSKFPTEQKTEPSVATESMGNTASTETVVLPIQENSGEQVKVYNDKTIMKSGARFGFLRKPNEKGEFDMNKVSEKEEAGSYFVINKDTNEIVPITSNEKKSRYFLNNKNILEDLIEESEDITENKIANLISPIKLEKNKKGKYVVSSMGAYKA